jgi:hypothetical protein
MILKLLSKGEKRDKMKRTIQTLAILIAMTLLVVWMVGCGGEEEEPVATAAGTTVNPAEGSEVAANAPITITFDEAVESATVNGQPATGSGKTWTFTGDLTGQTGIQIAWTNMDGSAGEGKSVAYTITALDADPPEITGSTPADGDGDLNPEDINNDGIEIEFNEALKKISAEVTIEGEPLKWTSELSDDKMTATLIMLPGGDVPYEAEIVVIITAEDNAGNKLEDAEITFTTAAKEE